jgi:hypothetical protein
MRVTIPAGTYFGIGFGSFMRNSDLIIWHAYAKNDNKQPFAGDYYGAADVYGGDAYLDDERNPEGDLTTTFKRGGNGSLVTFETKRPFETADFFNDFNIVANTEIEMMYSWNEETAET